MRREVLLDWPVRAARSGASAEWQAYTPTTPGTPAADANSLLQSASATTLTIGSESIPGLEVVLQSAGTYTDIDQAVVWDCGSLRDWLGRDRTLDVLTGLFVGEVVIEAVPGSQAYAGMVLADDAYGAATKGISNLVRSNGTGLETAASIIGGGGTWNAPVASGGHSALVRRSRQTYALNAGGTTIAIKSAYGLPASPTVGGGLINMARETTTYTAPAMNRVWLVAGWVSATGAPATATIRFGGRTLAMNVADLGAL